jgi:hypothetical protein
MNNFIQLSIADIVKAIVNGRGIQSPEVLAYLEPFMFKGSLTPVVNADGKPLLPRLTDNARLLRAITMKDIESFVDACRQLSDASVPLLRGVERRLKHLVSVCNPGSDNWHRVPANFSRGGECYYVRFQQLIALKDEFYGNASDISLEEIISILSFSDLSKVYYWLGRPLLRAKKDVSKAFGIAKPDTFSLGLRALSKLRNLDAHFLPSHRETIDQSFSDDRGTDMLNSWITGKCNLGKYYGKLCFLVYITTDFPDSDIQIARRKIKALLQRMPKTTVNYLGIPSGWLNEPLWANI